MFITRECDYAVRVVRALWGESRLSVSDICEKEAITAPFAYKDPEETSEGRDREGIQRRTWWLFSEQGTG